MEDRLTVRPAVSLESILTFSSIDSDDPGSRNAFQNPTLGKDKFITGVRRGFKNLGSFRGRPQDILTNESSSLPAPLSAPVTFDQSAQKTLVQHGRSLSSAANLEKPLPRPPQSPSPTEIQKPSSSPPDTPRLSGTMLKGTPESSRTTTMDSTTSVSHTQTYGQTKPSPTAFLVDPIDNQTNFASSSTYNDAESQDGKQEFVTPRSPEPVSVGPSPATHVQAESSGSQPLSVPSSSTHLSGLMCNVHRTTGREPHPLVGATTTILGDKLYVFGGRILSRTRPALTSDLYELDLIRRHWTKLEPSGEIPPPRYFHSMCSLGDTKLVCYGGMSPTPSPGQAAAVLTGPNGQDPQPEVVVMSDIHIYNVATNTWSYIPTQNTPQGRYAHCATILPSSAIFSSSNAPLSAIHHNPSSGNPNQGSIGVNIDGTGGAEMVVVGGQDSANHYIEQISVFNVRSLKWTSTQQLGKSCGAYRSVVAPLPGIISSRIGKTSPAREENSSSGISQEAREAGSSMLIYSNYNFLDVKLELQIRSADGTLTEKPMVGTYTPPGLRFPNGGLIGTHFVVSGTYLTSSKQEYALWALDLRSLTWSRIDAGGTVFSQGSWNRGVLWNRRNTFVILGNRKRSLVEDYNHRRLNFTNVCMVELEAFGLYDNPRKSTPMSGFVSASAPPVSPLPPPPGSAKLPSFNAGGRMLSKAAEDLGNIALSMREISDMDILAVGGERIPVNSRIVARRWGPYFNQLLREGSSTLDSNDTATLRPGNATANESSSYASAHHQPSRNSSITITPSFSGQSSNLSTSSTLHDGNVDPNNLGANSNRTAASFSEPPDPSTISPLTRPRTLFLPHTYLTLQALLHFLYTSLLPPSSSPLCTPQILCSLLQVARPYQIDGLAEAVVERLHGVLDSRNAAAVFNAAAMAAGGGRGLMPATDEKLSRNAQNDGADLAARTLEALRINTSVGNLGTGMSGRNNIESDDDDLPSGTSSVGSAWEGSENGQGSEASGFDGRRTGREEREVWNGGISCVIGLQKRGLRGLMEGRRLRERGASISRDATGVTGARLGLGVV